ncbi:putative AC transposase [Fusarium oxysporum f. sp. raphani]|uniref:Putative AC transposase n=1 Tax=Fusarium oxysporum f. sp. raphani TaxID=96318 RepID=A0A8J5U0J1_FUSOX|nr:putative AC transposase [Fusarium oxysporum f. sp. raphani]
MVSEPSSVPSTPSSDPDFIDVERFFTREKAKPRALYVCLYCKARPWKDGYKGNTRRHIRNHHPYLIGLSSRQNRSQQSLDTYITSSTTPSAAALRNAFNRQAYVDAIIGLVTRRRVAFAMVEWDELKDLVLACNPAIEDSLITSRRTVMRYISANYELYADHLAQSLQSAVSMIHISSDLWTSPHRHGMLAVCGQWVDKDYRLRKALLGLLECPKDHSGKSQAGLIADVLKRFGIRRVGYHTGDNATSNNTCLEALSEKLFNERELSFSRARKKLYKLLFMPPAMSLVHKSVETFSAALGESAPPASDIPVDQALEESHGRQQRDRNARREEFSGWEGIGALRKLHHLAVWLRNSPIHSDDWREAVNRNLGIDNTTRWSSWYKIISVALDKKVQIVQFMVDHDKDIGLTNLLTGADWDILSKTHAFLQPFTEATLITEGDKASICSTLRLMDGLLSHFEKAKIHYSTPEFHNSRMLHSIEMGWFVLNKYYTISEEAPVHVAALLLDPRCRKAYLDKNWKSAWINPAIVGVRQLWEEEYNINNSVNDIDGDIVTTPEDTPVAPGKPPSQLQILLQEMEVETTVSTDSDDLEAFINAPAIKIDCEPLEWWCRTEQRRQFPRLSRMAIDILSINPQSAEPERTFSGARRTASWDRLSITCERIEEVECLGNWMRNGHIVASRDGGLGLVCDPDGVNGNVDIEISDTE